MRGNGPFYGNAALVRSEGWNLPRSDKQQKHVRFLWIKRGGGTSSGSGPQGHKATRRALLSRALRERAGVAAAVTVRQAARVAVKNSPPKVIYGP